MLKYRTPTNHIFIEGPEGFGKSTLLSDVCKSPPYSSNATFIKYPSKALREILFEVEKMEKKIQLHYWLRDFYNSYLEEELEDNGSYDMSENKFTTRVYDRSFCSTIVYQLWQKHKARLVAEDDDLQKEFERLAFEIYGKKGDAMNVVILNTSLQKLSHENMIEQFSIPLLNRNTEVKDTVDLLGKSDLEKVILNLSQGYRRLSMSLPDMASFHNFHDLYVHEIDVLDENCKRKTREQIFQEFVELDLPSHHEF